MKVDDIKRVAVIGAGLMGHGKAMEFALGGYEVNLSSRSQESLQKALGRIRANLQLLVDAGMATPEQARLVPSRIHTSVALKEAVKDADVVVEVVYEDLALKQSVFRELDSLCPERTILVSGTSTLRLSDLQSATSRPDRVILANYSNPPFLVPLVEVMRNEATSNETVATLCELLTRIGKRPVVIQSEVPGFVANRLQMALLREALWLVQRGIVSAQDVDTIIKNSIGRRWAVAGVFEVFEIAGWDLILSAASWLLPYLETSPDVPQVLKDKVARGELGVKTGKGFYELDQQAAEALRLRIAHALIEIEKWSRQS